MTETVLIGPTIAPDPCCANPTSENQGSSARIIDEFARSTRPWLVSGAVMNLFLVDQGIFRMPFATLDVTFPLPNAQPRHFFASDGPRMETSPARRLHGRRKQDASGC